MQKYSFKAVDTLPNFNLTLPDARECLAGLDEESATFVVSKALRTINGAKGGIKLYDLSAKLWSVADFVGVVKQGMAISNATTLTAEDFATAWFGEGLKDAVMSLVDSTKLEAARELIAKSVRHGGKAQLSERECDGLLLRFADHAQAHDVLSVCVANAKTRKAEINAANTDI